MKFPLFGFRDLKAPLLAPRRIRALAAAGALGGLLAACGQDPGTTGLGYLEDQGVRVSAPLYHLVLEDLPLDSVFASDVPLGHFGESLLVVGREGPYLSKVRFGFQLTTAAQRDSLAAGLHLRFSALPLNGLLGNNSCVVPTTNATTICGGRAWLREEARNRDSLTLLVESYSWPDSTGNFQDSLSLYHRRFLTLPVPFTTVNGAFKVKDTIRVSPSGAYADSGVTQDTLQAGALPNLLRRLRTGAGSDTARNWLIYLEVSPLRTSDSGMFRFYTQATGNSETLLRYGSGLWLGRHDDANVNVGSLLPPYPNGFSYAPATQSETRYTGTSTRSLLHGVSRGVHLRIHRDTLLARIQAALTATYPADSARFRRLFTGTTGNTFDRRFFVPYAEMRLPLDTALSRVNGPFALDMSMASDVDSLDDPSQPFRDDLYVPAGDSLSLVVYGGGSYAPSAADTLWVGYQVHPGDPAYRQIVMRWAGDASVVDTVTLIPDGGHRELATRRPAGWSKAATLSVRADSARLQVGTYFSAAGVTEPRGFVDSTGKAITGNVAQARRYWRPGADSLNVRVTRGVRGILNRVDKSGIAPDMFLRSVERAVYDTSTVSGASYRRVEYPVRGEIEFKRGGDGRVRIGLDLYLYPLEAGQ